MFREKEGTAVEANCFSDKVVYQIYPKSFQDSNTDGIGDLPGIMSRLGYLKTLGVDYLLLTPFFQSPQRNDGYDVADYRSVDTVFGTMEELEVLIHEAGEKGIGIMLDMVFNHTSTAHEWFQKALHGDEKYMDYYIFRDGEDTQPPTNWSSKFGGPAWEYVEDMNKWYLHLYDVTQADLNWDNPKVREELKDILCFWKEKGIRGFRFADINLISKPEIYTDDDLGDGKRLYTDGPHAHEYLKELVKDTGIENMITVGEMSSATLAHCISYSNPENKELSMCMYELIPPDSKGVKRLLTDWQLGMQAGKGWSALFWCNHDQPRIVSRLGNTGEYRETSAKMLAAVIHMQRGTPFIFQGEELGMMNADFDEIDQYRDEDSLNYYKTMMEKGNSHDEAMDTLAAYSRDNSRTPMQWNDEKYAGFSEMEPWISIPANIKSIHASAQWDTEDSVFSFYKDLISLRKRKEVIAKGHIAFLFQENDDVLVFRRYWDQEDILVFNNLCGNIIVLEPAAYISEYVKIMGNYHTIQTEQECIHLRPYETIILEKKISEMKSLNVSDLD